MRFGPLVARTLGVFATVGGLIAACGGRSNLLDQGAAAVSLDGGPDMGVPPGCGDGRCDDAETCTTCPLDCGLCPGCGDHKCGNGETCASCPQDCDVCATCGDGFCNGGETCLSCAPDCGVCPGCGDGRCQPPSENCFTCPHDCGKCAGCGDGICLPPETCASCAQDCGVCAVCGNGKCEGPYETCANCPKDCGACTTIGCPEMLMCAVSCVDLSQKPPNISVTCVADCVARGCPSAQFFFDQAFNCFIQHFQDCGSNFGCLSQKCSSEVAACIGATRCPVGQGGG